jgi:RNA polymerase sigma factor (sigma-70 family)
MVKAVPGTLREGGASFVTTHWSVVAACPRDSENTEAALAALTQLCRDYWPPLYSFVRRRGYNSADAQDLVQGFFAYLLANKSYAQTDRNKGKFRSFLLASIKHYMADVWDRERAFKRGGDREFVLLDDEMDAAERLYASDSTATMLDEEQQYERRWAAALVTRALERLEAEFGGSRALIFKELKPFLSGGVGLPSQEEIATKLDMPVETLRSHLSRLRARYRDMLREEVARTIAAKEDVDEELRHLRQVLSAAT